MLDQFPDPNIYLAIMTFIPQPLLVFLVAVDIPPHFGLFDFRVATKRTPHVEQVVLFAHETLTIGGNELCVFQVNV